MSKRKKKKLKKKPAAAVGENLTELLAADLDQCDVTVCLASWERDAVAPSYQRLVISVGLGDQFRSIVTEQLSMLRRDQDEGDLLLRKHEAGSKPDKHEVEYLYDSEFGLNALVAELTSPTDALPFGEEADFVKSLRFYAIVLQADHVAPVVAFRWYTPKKELGRSKMFGIFSSKGSYNRFDEPLFLFDEYLDCLWFNGVFYIVNANKFRTMFRFFDLLKKTARETLESIHARVPIKNFDEMLEACEGHLQMLAKLRNIAAKGYLEDLSLPSLKKQAERFGLEVVFEEDDGEEMVVFDKANKWELLRLFDDDYLDSRLTDSQYEVTGKRRVDGS